MGLAVRQDSGSSSHPPAIAVFAFYQMKSAMGY